MKYAVITILDQTVGYLDHNGSWTTTPAEARLIDDRADADAIVGKMRADWEAAVRQGAADPTNEHRALHQRALDERWFEDDPAVEVVEDETTFRAQEDTW